MITLATLPEASAQEVIDQVARHLLVQGKKSIRVKGVNTNCLYRNSDGTKCAAGCLISDEEYDPSFEKTTWMSLCAEGRVPPDHEALIVKLQEIHDFELPSKWEQKLEKLADALSLQGDFRGRLLNTEEK